ncbi:Putative ankyrin repeat-containing domain superfamily [Colletotrichum destructivum]|uniref:Ankyrin repeat-containing domain superfamily n=1 Tax=Colletotrichum destructivum TaxID=34406 RepID=A0AAX4I5H8_9PEZI|nr:Putative ankyrin repeat-containing domain superfamily [Colletotrichum destructivum]
MDTIQPQNLDTMYKRLDWHFHHIAFTNQERRSKIRSKSEISPGLFSDICELKARFAELPPLPPRLPRPDYAIEDGLLNPQDTTELDFYCACRMGYRDDVEAYVRKVMPSHAVRQFGLQMASFGNQPSIARYLLQIGTKLHGYVFEGTEPGSKRRQILKGASIFQVYPKGDVLIPLLQTFVEAGWHPNQAWESTQDTWPVWSLFYPSCVWNTSLVGFLLSCGADPNIGSCWPDLQALHGIQERFDYSLEIPLHRQSTWTFELAIEGCDPTAFEMLRASSGLPVKVANLSPMFILALSTENHEAKRSNGQSVSSDLSPFVGLRAIAEHMLTFNNVDIDRIKIMENGEKQTALTCACSIGNWDFVQWLLEKEADPFLLDGKAFSYNCEQLRGLMERVAAANPARAIQFGNQKAMSNWQILGEGN